MKLQEMIDRGYKLRAWTISKVRGERRIAVRLCKVTDHGTRFYIMHSPQVDRVLADVEFTAPVPLEYRRNK